MPKTCCVYGCNTNTKTERRNRAPGKVINVFRFPDKDDEPFEHRRWISVVGKINANLKVGEETVVCSLHWPDGFEKIKVRGKWRPVHPPSSFKGIPPSIVPAPPPPQRTTTRTSCHERNTEYDELAEFYRLDNITYSSLKETLLTNKKSFAVRFTTFENNDALFIQSLEFSSVPSFLLKIYESLKFETFHLGVQCYVTTLSKNRVIKIDKWSKFEEALRFLSSRELDNKMTVLQEQFAAMAPQKVGKPVYSHEIIVRAFEYFSTSRSLYNRLRTDFKLPSIQVLTRITSKVSKLSESKFLWNVFSSIEENQKECVLLHDEVYVKKMLLYHGGTLFGRAVNDPSSLAKTVLGIMVVCLYGGPSFLTKMLPVSGLKSAFIREVIDATQAAITSSGGKVIATICDGNRTNQRFMRSYDTVPGKPWLTTDGKFLLFDFVHLLKCIRNNWITERTGELIYDDNGVTRTAKWCHLKQLYVFESANPLTRLSSLTEISVAPKPIERQKVSHALSVFCDKTYTALLTHPKMSDVEGVEDTAIFIKKVIEFWKIMNVKGLGADKRHNDPLEKVIEDPDDYRLGLIANFGEMALEMSAVSQGKRVKQLTKDTARAIHHTCSGVVDLTKYLLKTSHKYVVLNKFSTDRLEKGFGKLREGLGGTYFITVQQVIEKTNIQKASLLLSLNSTGELNVVDGHECSSCGYMLDEEDAEIFDNLEQLEESIPLETKMALVYIAGYVTRKDPALSEEKDLLSQTTFYHQKFGDYLDSLDRGLLNVPSDCSCQWTFFCYIMFNSVKQKVCRKSLCNIFMLITEFHSLEMEKHHGTILANIFLKNFCITVNPRSNKESSLKVIKLSI